jgi:hypothetical protein
LGKRDSQGITALPRGGKYSDVIITGHRVEIIGESVVSSASLVIGASESVVIVLPGAGVWVRLYRPLVVQGIQFVS